MNTDGFTFQSTLEANYLNISLEEDAAIDEIAVKVIREDCPDFLIPFRLMSMNDNLILKYKLINTVALEYANKKLSKADFVRLYLNLLTPFIKGKDWFLDYHNLCVDPRYVFLDKYNEKVYFIYVPEASHCSTENEISDFFRDVFRSAEITDDKDFQVKLYRYFTGGEITLIDLYQMFQEEQKNVDRIPGTPSGRDVEPQRYEAPPVSPVNPKPVSMGSPKPAQQPAVAPQPTPKIPEEKKEEDDIMNQLFGNDKKKKEKTKKTKAEKKERPSKAEKLDSAEKNGDGAKKGLGIFGGFGHGSKKKEESQSQPVYQESGYRSNSLQNDVTAVPSYNPLYDQSGEMTEIGDSGYGGGVRRYLELTYSPFPGAPQRISLEFSTPYINIGRKSSDEIQPDIAFPGEFRRMGRMHARIENDNGSLRVIDLGSRNHTFLSGQQLVPNVPYPLTDGLELTFTEDQPVRYRVHC
ncbi:MAG: DUF6382 domain-containing protein [Lachnospiraceae bacterium]|nr:DUF6382 domain-containing protein [Lachnospiraceae bacterium]